MMFSPRNAEFLVAKGAIGGLRVLHPRGKDVFPYVLFEGINLQLGMGQLSRQLVQRLLVLGGLGSSGFISHAQTFVILLRIEARLGKPANADNFQ